MRLAVLMRELCRLFVWLLPLGPDILFDVCLEVVNDHFVRELHAPLTLDLSFPHRLHKIVLLDLWELTRRRLHDTL